MMRRTVALLALLLMVLPAASVWPLGVGSIELRSALNERFVARIPLRSVAEGDIEGMTVSLGSPAQFERAGLDRPFVLTELMFQVVPTDSGAYISVSSQNPVSEPFLNFLVEVNWPRGRVIREYTVLLDPPLYGSAIASTVRQTVPTVSTMPSLGAPSVAEVLTPSPAAPAAVAPSVAAVVAPPAPAPSAPVRLPAPARAPGTYGPVSETDTLWSLADRFRPEGRSIQQTMLAILAANPEAFIQSNVNALRAGVVLRIPAGDEVGRLSRAEALAEVERQHAAWQDIRRSLAAAPTPILPDSGATAATVATDAVAVEEPVAVEVTTPSTVAAQAESRLELLGSGSAVEGAVGAPEQGTSVSELRDELTLALEELEANRRQGEELQSRLSAAEQLVDDLRSLVQLKDESISTLQQQLARSAEQERAAVEVPVEGETTATTLSLPDGTGGELATAQIPPPVPASTQEPIAGTEPAVPSVDAAPAVSTEAGAAATVAPAVQPQEQPAAPQKPTVPLPPPPQPKPTSYIEIARELLPFNPLLLAGGVGGLVLLGLLALVIRKRRSAAGGGDVDVPSSSIGGKSLVDRYAGSDERTIGGSEPTELPGRAHVPPRDVSEATTQVGLEHTQHPVTRTGDDDDPLAEVNNYLAYEHFDQAERLVRRAVEKYPDRPEYRLRLLEVLQQAGNVPAFAVAATALRESVGQDHPLVARASVLWAELAPGSELFKAPGGEDRVSSFSQTHVGLNLEQDEIFDVTGTELAGGANSAVDFDLGFEMTSPDDRTSTSRADEPVDFGLDFTPDDGATATGADVADSAVDFSLDDTEVPDSQGERAAPAVAVAEAEPGVNDAGDDVRFDEPGLDFDLGGGTEADTSVDFDLGQRSPADAGDLVPSADDSGIDFELGDAAAEVDLERAMSADDSGIDFDLGDAAAEPGPRQFAADDSSVDFDLDQLDAVEEDPDAYRREAADETKPQDHAGVGDDMQIDFDTGDLTVTDSTSADHASPEADDLGLDFDLGEPSAPRDDQQAGDGGRRMGLEVTSELDFDIGGDDSPTRDLSSGIAELSQGLKRPASAPAVDSGGQVGTVDRGLLAEAGEDELTAGSDTALDLDFGIRSDAAAQDERTASLLDFDLGDVEEGAPGADGAQSAGNASASDDVLDFDFGSFASDAPASPDSSALGMSDADDEGQAFDTVQIKFDESAEMSAERDESPNMVEAAVARRDGELDFDLGGDDESNGSMLDFELDLPDSRPGAAGFDLSGDDDEDSRTLALGRGASGELDEIQTKLDLAQAYIDMEDIESARGILGEVMAEGSELQKDQARLLLSRIN